MITENLSTLKIHKLTQAQYDRERDAGNLDESAMYLTPYEDFVIEDTTYPGCFYRMVGEDQEWLNPPMVNAALASTNVPTSIPENCEYRTTQRWMGKPVYTMLVYFGEYSGTGLITKFYYPAGIIERVLKIEGSLNDGRAIPLAENSVAGTMGFVLGASGNAIGLTGINGSYSAKEPIMQVWYTKKEV